MLENDCLILDIKMTGMAAIKENKLTSEEYEKHIDAYNRVTQLNFTITDCEEKVDLVIDAISLNICKDPKNEEKIRSSYQPRLDFLLKKIQEKVSII